MGKFKKQFKNGSSGNKHYKKPLIKTRKQLRKEKRKEKKQRKNEHYKKKFLNIKNDSNAKLQEIKSQPQTSNLTASKQIKPSKKCSKGSTDGKPRAFEMQIENRKNELKMLKKLEKETKIQRKKQLVMENKNEDEVIRKLEKQLRLNKRKSETLPQSFADEGLDYLLDICDESKVKSAVEAEKNLQDSDSEFEEDFAVVTGKKKEIKNTKENQIGKVDEYSSEDDRDERNDVDDSNDEVGEEEDDAFCSVGGDDDDDDDNDDIGSAFEESDSEDGKSLPKKRKVDNGHNFNKNDYKNDDSGDEESDYSLDGEEKFNDGDEGENYDNDEEINDISKTRKKGSSDKTYEDIYGRKRDKQGNIIPVAEKYVPPHLKAKLLENSGREELIARLRKQIKGLLNRLAENNMHNIASQMDQLYMQNSRNDMNETLTKLIFESLIQPVLVSERLIVEHAMLIAALHANVGTEIGAHFLQAVVEKFDSLFGSESKTDGKEMDNILLIIAYLYSFKIFNCVLIFDILNKITDVSTFGENEVELLLIVLRGVGFILRKDDPVAVKNVILKVQSIVGNNTELSNKSRVRYMLDVLTGIKNNNTSKIRNYDPNQIEHYRKLLRTLIHKGKYVSELNISLEDLLKAPEKGRWWIVGSAWTGGDNSKQNNVNSNNDTNDINKSLIDLAKKHRMSTDARRNIFCILISAEDYMDAFEKLLKLGLKGPQEQTIMHVVVHCVLQEKNFNPYYAYLAAQFCSTDRKYQMNFQYHLWDRIRELDDLKGFQITNLALFLSHLILEKALPLSVLKVIEFASLSKPFVRLLRRIFLTVLLANNEEAFTEVFQKIARSSKLNLFKESIRLFFHHFILRNINEDSDQMIKLKERVKLAEKLMNFIS